MSTAEAAFYRALGEGRFASTGLTRGPWSPDAQHGGPPMALLGTRMALAAAEGARAGRVTCELLRPIPLAALRVEVEVVRAGQLVSWIEGALWADGPRGETCVMRARGVWVRAREVEAPALRDAGIAGPEEGERWEGAAWGLPWEEGYHTAMELVRREEAGRRVAWLKPRVALVEGEAWTALGRALVAVDSIGGVCARLPFSAWSFVNAETTCHLVREVEGEWVALAGTQWVEPDGVGLAEAALHDVRGAVGRGLQSQVVARRK